MHDLTVSAIGEDRPGIVAAVTGVLLEHGCNLADCSMSLLRRQFAMILLVEAPDELSHEALQIALRKPAEQLGLVTSVREVAHAETTSPSRPYVVSVYGPDRPGIVHGIASVLAGRQANITDLMSRLAGEDVYTVIIDADLPPDADADGLAGELRAAAGELGIEITFRASETVDL
ncbi:MAG TPA: ACT domain-containing protein [Actinomycetota bacterium]|jgi:glycine cleavage system transcriptional repressor